MAVGSLTLDKSRSLRRPARLAPFAEFLVTGGATLFLIPAAWWFQKTSGLEQSEYLVSFWAFYAAYLINDPHFGVTYFLFYRGARGRLLGPSFSGAQRARYAVAAIAIPIVMLAWISWALVQSSGEALGGLIQVMFFLVGWHYVKQGFGVMMVLSARRGVGFSQHERWALLSHAFAAWAYAWSSPAEIGNQYEESGIVYTALAHPAGLEHVTGGLFFLSGGILVWFLIRKWLRERTFPPLAALTGYVMSLWLWTVYSSFDPLMAYVIPGLHSLQYLYFVYLLKKNEARAEQGEPKFGRPVGARLAVLAISSIVLGYLILTGIPNFLDETLMGTHAESAPAGPLGATPFLAAFVVFVNIHHYFMDHVIWRRENPETKFLRD